MYRMGKDKNDREYDFVARAKGLCVSRSWHRDL